MRPARNHLTRPIKSALKRQFPALWIRWHLLHSVVEPELSLLKHIVPHGGVTVDIGANFGLYTRALAKISNVVHAFEPSKPMARMLRQTSAANVVVHEVALSDRSGEAQLRIPSGANGPVYSLASIEPNVAHMAEPCVSMEVPLVRLDSIVRDGVNFVKIDVEGHELRVLEGALGMLEQSKPVFLVEAEERHRPGAASSIFQFFRNRDYQGFFLSGNSVRGTEEFEAAALQDRGSLQPDGTRKPGRRYVNNFFFFPPSLDGRQMLSAALRSNQPAS